MILKYFPHYLIQTTKYNSNRILRCQTLCNIKTNITNYDQPNLTFQQKNVCSTFTNCNTKTNLFKCNFPSNKLNSECFSTSVLHLNHKHDDKELDSIAARFPEPKSIVNNVYQVVSSELKIPTPLVIHFSHKIKNKNIYEWHCTYHIKWPEEAKVTATAHTKSEATKKAAEKLLHLLHKNEKISDKGLPKIYDKETYKKITKNTCLPMILDETAENNLKQICNIYERYLKEEVNNLSHETSTVDENSNVNIENNVIGTWSILNQTHKNIYSYFAKETVELPIQQHKEEIEKLMENNRVVIVRGEPGCGKSTRVPQYILEHWVKSKGEEPVRIICTQPRRIAAISLAERVANERGERVGDVVGFQVRLHSNFNPQTGRILYCTTGILLRQLQADPCLENCTHIIIDEAHERDIFTDLLMNLLRNALDRNPNIKIIVMSATMDTDLFKNYFDNAPIIEIPGFTYPVKQHFIEDIKLNLDRTKNMSENNSPFIMYEDVAKVIRWIHDSKPEGAILCFLPGWDEISKVKYSLEKILDPSTSMLLTLHSKLSDKDQHKIFSHPPAGVRKIVLGTNIAETSVTIDDVVYVVDTGIHKETRFDSEKGITCLGNHWISKSSLHQRKGRAGRVQPGESYHLFSKEKYKSLPEFSIPEILRISLDKIVLDAKVYSQNMNAIEFFSKLPCPPSDTTVLKAVDELKDLELLDQNENVTPLGKVLSEFQLPPKLSKAMVQSVIYKCVTPIVDIATIFSTGTDMFSTTLIDKPGIKRIKENTSKTSDHIALMLIFEQWLEFLQDEEYMKADSYCIRNNLARYKMHTLKKLETIHFEYLEKYLKNVIRLSDKYSDNDEIVKGVLLSGVGNILTNRKWDIVKGRLKAVDTYINKYNHKATITPESVNSKKGKYKSPYFIYINETKSLLRSSMLIRETSLINPLTVLLFKNGELTAKRSQDEADDIKDGVILAFKDTNIKVLLNERQARLVLLCKEAMKNIEQYFIHQLTVSGGQNNIVLENWDQILDIISETLHSDKPENIKS